MEALDVSKTIIPKSDQLNADDLLTDDKIITVTKVTMSNSADQPVSVHYEGDDGRPFKPCKSMRRVLIALWGQMANEWAGRSIRLYCDPTVKFGGSEVGGIRISHLTDIDQEKTIMLTVSRARRSGYTVKPMASEQKPPLPDDMFNEKLADVEVWIESGEGTAERAIARLSKYGTMSKEQRERIRAIGPQDTD